MAQWTFEGYWNAVLGANRNAADVVREFDLSGPLTDRASQELDEWLDAAEVEAWRVGGERGERMPKAWGDFHDRTLILLEAAIEAKEPTIILAPSDMGGEATEADTEADYDAWVIFVCAHVDEAAGYEVDVESLPWESAEETSYRGSDEQRAHLRGVLETLWTRWLASLGEYKP